MRIHVELTQAEYKEIAKAGGPQEVERYFNNRLGMDFRLESMDAATGTSIEPVKRYYCTLRAYTKNDPPPAPCRYLEPDSSQETP